MSPEMFRGGPLPRKKVRTNGAEARLQPEVYLSLTRVDFYPFDDAYLRRLREGDAATEAHFVAYFSPLLRLKLRGRIDASQTVEDLCQETFLRVLVAVRAGTAIRNPERLGAFVNSTCRYVLMEWYRGITRALKVDSADMDSIPLPDRYTNAEYSLVEQESKEKNKRTVQAVIAELSPRDQEFLRAVFYEERDKDELCSRFGVDRAYLRILLHRAKTRFRCLYESKRPSDA